MDQGMDIRPGARDLREKVDYARAATGYADAA